MPYKDKAVKRAKDSLYKKAYYLRNRDAVQARVARNKKLSREKWAEFKASYPCTHCGASHPAIIDFHHVVRDGTQRSVNRLAADNKWTQVYEEVKKCIPLCANCHRILHWNESRSQAIVKNMVGRTEKRTLGSTQDNTLESMNDDDSGAVEHS